MDEAARISPNSLNASVDVTDARNCRRSLHQPGQRLPSIPEPTKWAPWPRRSGLDSNGDVTFYYELSDGRTVSRSMLEIACSPAPSTGFGDLLVTATSSAMQQVALAD